MFDIRNKKYRILFLAREISLHLADTLFSLLSVEKIFGDIPCEPNSCEISARYERERESAGRVDAGGVIMVNVNNLYNQHRGFIKHVRFTGKVANNTTCRARHKARWRRFIDKLIKERQITEHLVDIVDDDGRNIWIYERSCVFLI